MQHIKAVLNISESSTSVSTSITELDSHADSPVVGENSMILYKTEMTVNVTPFSDDFGMMPKVPVVRAAVAYYFPITRYSKIPIINNALYIREMDHNLLAPIMMRLNGLLVSRSSSRWNFHFHSYVLTIYVRLYRILELVVFYSCT